MKRNKSLHLLTLLATGVLLAACQAKEEAHPQPVTPSSSSVVVTQSSSSTKASSSKASSSKRLQAQAAGQDASQVAEGSEGAALPEQEEAGVVATSQASVASPEWQEEAPSLAVETEEALASGEAFSDDGQATPQGEAATESSFDYSPMAGTWVNGKGEVLVMDSNGLVSMNGYSGSEFELTTPLVGNSGKISMGAAPINGYGGVTITYLPSGAMVSTTEGPLEETLDERDYISVGHSLPTAEERFYRQ